MKILIAEDEIGIGETYQVVLESRGHEVTVTHDGIKCLQVYREALSEIDIANAGTATLAGAGRAREK